MAAVLPLIASLPGIAGDVTEVIGAAGKVAHMVGKALKWIGHTIFGIGNADDSPVGVIHGTIIANGATSFNAVRSLLGRSFSASARKLLSEDPQVIGQMTKSALRQLLLSEAERLRSDWNQFALKLTSNEPSTVQTAVDNASTRVATLKGMTGQVGRVDLVTDIAENVSEKAGDATPEKQVQNIIQQRKYTAAIYRWLSRIAAVARLIDADLDARADIPVGASILLGMPEPSDILSSDPATAAVRRQDADQFLAFVTSLDATQLSMTGSDVVKMAFVGSVVNEFSTNYNGTVLDSYTLNGPMYTGSIYIRSVPNVTSVELPTYASRFWMIYPEEHLVTETETTLYKRDLYVKGTWSVQAGIAHNDEDIGFNDDFPPSIGMVVMAFKVPKNDNLCRADMFSADTVVAQLIDQFTVTAVKTYTVKNADGTVRKRVDYQAIIEHRAMSTPNECVFYIVAPQNQQVPLGTYHTNAYPTSGSTVYSTGSQISMNGLYPAGWGFPVSAGGFDQLATYRDGFTNDVVKYSIEQVLDLSKLNAPVSAVVVVDGVPTWSRLEEPIIDYLGTIVLGKSGYASDSGRFTSSIGVGAIESWLKGVHLKPEIWQAFKTSFNLKVPDNPIDFLINGAPGVKDPQSMRALIERMFGLITKDSSWLTRTSEVTSISGSN